LNLARPYCGFDLGRATLWFNSPQSPNEIRLTFADTIKDGTITLIAKDFTPQVLQTQSGATDAVVFAQLETPLTQGKYTVEYDLVSSDDRDLRGSYTIEIQGESQGGRVWMIGAGVLLLVGGLGLLGFRGQRS